MVEPRLGVEGVGVAKRHNILRDIPRDLAEAAKAEAARRKMSIKNWLIETIRFRLDLIDPPKEKRSRQKPDVGAGALARASAPLPRCPICCQSCELENCVTDERGRAVHEACYTVQIGRAS